MKGQGKRFFDKRIKLIEILNETKDENDISKITNKELQTRLEIGETSLNNLIREINEEELIISRYKEWYKINVTNLNEIKKYNRMIKIIKELINNPKELNENEINIAMKYGIERKELQRIKTIIKMF